MTIDAPSPSQIPDLRRLWQEAFGDTDAFLDDFFSVAFACQRCRCVTLDGEVVAALYWFDCSYTYGRVAYLYAIATAANKRGRGICRRLMEDTHRHLASLGYVGAVLVPGDSSLFAFYERFGYRAFGALHELESRATAPTVVEVLDAAAYAARRRILLPPDGVVQEGENLAFLQRQATLYGGDGFVLAARRKNRELYGLEFLGDAKQVPHILATLGCAVGQFRTVGEGRSFAMYLPLGDASFPPPAYFGLAFD